MTVDIKTVHVWIDGTRAQLSVRYPGQGPILAGELPLLVAAARCASESGELLRFTYSQTDPETGETTSGAARLMIEPLQDPRTQGDACGKCGAPASAHVAWASGHLYVDPTACAKCKTPFDADDPRYPGRARYYNTPYCRSCTDRCEETEIADHRCMVCA